jgi:hypothetical protein
MRPFEYYKQLASSPENNDVAGHFLAVAAELHTKGQATQHTSEADIKAVVENHLGEVCIDLSPRLTEVVTDYLQTQAL